MFNEKIVVSVTPFSGTTTLDKNGEQPVMLQCIAGKMPNRNVLSGTVAKRAGIVVGETYLMQVREIGYDSEFGRTFNFVKIKQLSSGRDIAETCDVLGEPEIVEIPRPAGFQDAYQRKGDAIEGQITKRIKEGKFKPAYPRSTDHSNAEDVKDGVSVGENENRMDGSKLKDNADLNKV